MKTLTILFALTLAMLVTEAPLLGQNHNMNHNALSANPVESEHSLYHLKDTWTDHRGHQFELADLQGNPVVVVMFYGNCTQVCPILIRDARRVYEAVDSELRDEVSVLAVTFDPDNDTPDVLKDYAVNKGLDIPEWQFVTGEQAGIRKLAMVLGVQYAEKSDGHFSHSNLVTVLDIEGRILQRIEGLNQPVEEAAEKIERQLQNESPSKQIES